MGNEQVNDLAVDPHNGAVVGRHTGRHLHQRQRRRSWQPASTGLTARFILAVAVDPADSACPLCRNRRRRCLHDRRRWSELASCQRRRGSQLATASVTDLAVDPTTPDTIYAATSLGVLVSRNAGANWAGLTTGLFVRAINALAVDPLDRAASMRAPTAAACSPCSSPHSFAATVRASRRAVRPRRVERRRRLLLRARLSLYLRRNAVHQRWQRLHRRRLRRQRHRMHARRHHRPRATTAMPAPPATTVRAAACIGGAPLACDRLPDMRSRRRLRRSGLHDHPNHVTHRHAHQYATPDADATPINTLTSNARQYADENAGQHRDHDGGQYADDHPDQHTDDHATSTLTQASTETPTTCRPTPPYARRPQPRRYTDHDRIGRAAGHADEPAIGDPHRPSRSSAPATATATGRDDRRARSRRLHRPRRGSAQHLFVARSQRQRYGRDQRAVRAVENALGGCR